MARKVSIPRSQTIFYALSVACGIWIAQKMPALLVAASTSKPYTLLRRSTENFTNFDGYGFRISDSCKFDATQLLNNANEFNKAGSAAATTLMTLLPSLLTFGPLPTADVRDLIYTSPWVAFWTAGMLFGMPCSKLTSDAAQRVLTSAQLGIEYVRKPSKRRGAPSLDQQSSGQSSSTEIDGPYQERNPIDEEELRELIFDREPDPDSYYRNPDESPDCQREAHRNAYDVETGEKRNQRLHMWQLYFITTFVGALQAILFMAILVGLPLINKMKIIWLCPEVSPAIYSGWLAGSYAVSSLVMVYWNSTFGRPQMIFHITPVHYVEEHTGEQAQSVFTTKPPVRKFMEFIWHPFSQNPLPREEIPRIRINSSVTAVSQDSPAENRRLSKKERIEQLGIEKFEKIKPGLWDSLKFGLWLCTPLGVKKHHEEGKPQIIEFGDYRHTESPLVLVIRVADDKVKQHSHRFVRTVGGFCQAAMLILLTVLFGSMYGQELFLSLSFIIAFTAAIYVCRLSSIWATHRLQKATELTIIECQNYTEMDEAQKMLLMIDGHLIKNKTTGMSYLQQKRVPTHVRVRRGGKPFLVSFFYCGMAYAVGVIVMLALFLTVWKENKVSFYTNLAFVLFLGIVGGVFARADFLEKSGHNLKQRESVTSKKARKSPTTTNGFSPSTSGETQNTGNEETPRLELHDEKKNTTSTHIAPLVG